MSIYIEWLIQEQLEKNPLIEAAVEATIAYFDIKESLEVSVSLVDNDEIAAINEEQRNIKGPTDVLSFPMIEFGDLTMLEALGSAMVSPETGEIYLGDMVLSMDKVVSQAEDYGHSVEREMTFLVVHSMLHLLGYDHMTPDEEQEMIRLQKEILEAMGMSR